MKNLEIRIKHILMVDDDHDDCYIFEEALKEITAKIHFSCLTDSELLTQHLQQHKPDLIFLDINMPRKNGFDCLEEIKGNPLSSDITVIMFSNSTRPPELEEAFNKGASLFIKKPASHVLLVDVLAKVLQRNWVQEEEMTSRFLFDINHYPH